VKRVLPIQLTVTDVKQFLYCPRIVYFTYSLPVKGPVTYKMEEGKLQHERTADLEERRSLRAYGLEKGERHFSVGLYSERLGLSGLLDMVILTSAGEPIPVEFKHSDAKLGLNHKYQLTAYALLVEDRWGTPVRRAFIYFIPLKRARETSITPNMRRFVQKTLDEIRDMIATEAMPEPTRHRGRCVDCEYRNFCGDLD
jgi:CRISPR-associated exonuclease Cas4